MSNEKKVQLTVVVNGEPVQVDVNENAPLHSIVEKALHLTNNQGQPKENWELRDADGGLLDGAKKVKDHGFGDGTRVFLNLKAGIGGSWAFSTRNQRSR